MSLVEVEIGKKVIATSTPPSTPNFPKSTPKSLVHSRCLPLDRYLDPKLDGNCGFRAIVFSVKRNDRAYQDEDQYLEVINKMLRLSLSIKKLILRIFLHFKLT
ncbi:hypothetical protein EDC96DRAFT_569994 [Choanephora cucurbitarum]|nr:hypothetical protein EDC96DRAFT_569994 [Choanephora cucurbitarum]